tara:strand:- start:42 stop:485 length:444 start_codon:yes stop_codon:yes gene_type:complete
MTKKELIKNLQETYCTIGVSKVHGVGVVAIRDIPINTNPFSCMKFDNHTVIDEKDLKSIPLEVVKKIQDVFIRVDKKYYIYNLGLNNMGAKFYINHSDEPNVVLNHKPEDKYVAFKTCKVIKKGEELFWNYKTYPAKNLFNQFKFLT